MQPIKELEMMTDIIFSKQKHFTKITRDELEKILNFRPTTKHGHGYYTCIFLLIICFDCV